jgi:hypothetical protein
MDNSKKSYIPHFFAIILFAIIALFYCSPLLDGKELVGGDTEGWIGMAQESKQYNETHEDVALWTDAMFGGMPTFQITMAKQTPDLLNIVVGSTLYQLPHVLFVIFLYMVGFYILMQCLGLNPWLSIGVAIAGAFCSYNLIILTAGHNTKAVAIAYMAPVIGSVIYTMRKNRLAGALIFTIVLALFIKANHLQINYYTIIILLCYGLSELFFAIKEKQVVEKLKSFSLLLLGAIIAVMLNATMLLMTKEYSQYTMRGESNGLTLIPSGEQEGLEIDYITNWSYGIDETMTLLIPNYKGGPSVSHLPADSETGRVLERLGVGDIEDVMSKIPFPTYWGTQPGTSGPVYAGAIVVFLFVLGLLLVSHRDKWWILFGVILSILLSWGRNFMPFTEFFVDYVPLYNMFRAVSMTLVITCCLMVLMSGLALKAFFDEEICITKKLRSLLFSGTFVGGICLLFALFPSIAGDFSATSDAFLVSYGYPEEVKSTILKDRAMLLSSDAWRSFVFILLTAVALWISLKWKSVKKEYIFAILVVLVLCDMVPVAKRYLNNDNFTEKKIGAHFSPSFADKEILKDKTHFRVLDLTVDVFNSSRPSYFHKTIGGYHAAKLRRYQELISCGLQAEVDAVRNALIVCQQNQSMEPLDEVLQQTSLLNMLNLKYVIYHGEAMPIQNPNMNGPVWFVDQVRWVDGADMEMTQTLQSNTKQIAVIDQSFSSQINDFVADSTAIITMTSYSPNVVKYSSVAEKDQLAVFSEIYYEKGWNAYIDGEKVDYARANYVLRALMIPAGEHLIEFRFEPSTYTLSNVIRGVSSVLLLSLIVVYFVVRYKKRKKKLIKENE